MCTTEITDVKELGETLLDVAAFLMNNGASSNRVRLTVSRISEAFGYQSNLLILNTALTLSLNKGGEENIYNSLRRTMPPIVNFRIVSAISRLSWSVEDKKLSINHINEELIRIGKLEHYPRIVTLSLVALAGASFCRIFDGGIFEMGVAFVATFVGLFVRQELTKRGTMLYISVFFAAFVSSFVAGMTGRIFQFEHIEHAFAASVLFLIPGVSLINAVSDLLDGNILTGFARGVHGMIIGFSISFGMFLSTIIFGF